VERRFPNSSDSSKSKDNDFRSSFNYCLIIELLSLATPFTIEPIESRVRFIMHDAPKAARLADFFRCASPLIREIGKPRRWPITAPHLATVLGQMHAPLERIRSAASANIWITAGLRTDEVRICAVLAKLWDWHHYGSEGRLFLLRCLTVLGPERAPDICELGRGYRIQTEHCLNGLLADRVDITIETDRSVVGVEVKIYAGEGNQQLARYVKSIALRAELIRRSNPQVIFLSPRGPSNQYKSGRWLTWRQVADAAALANPATSAGFQIHAFGQFCRNLGQ
jgi:hypothetical protein